MKDIAVHLLRRLLPVIAVLAVVLALVALLSSHDSRPAEPGQLMISTTTSPGFEIQTFYFRRGDAEAREIMKRIYDPETGEGDSEGDLTPILWAVRGSDEGIVRASLGSEAELLRAIAEAGFDLTPPPTPASRGTTRPALMTYTITRSAR